MKWYDYITETLNGMVPYVGKNKDELQKLDAIIISIIGDLMRKSFQAGHAKGAADSQPDLEFNFDVDKVYSEKKYREWVKGVEL